MSGIKVEYEVTDGGSTGKLLNATGLLKKDLDNIGASASRAGIAVKAAMQPTGGSKTKAAIQGASASSSDLLDYNQAKGIGGMTGAAGRDFAKQAQGLGGLVHVYATFAANLFAVSAAFTALKEAASTENMVKGLDQLGAASGKNLGTLSKQIAESTGGALSLRDAMTAVAQASSAGLGNEQIKDLTTVAAKASNALGISMTDAVSRLSRGISKIEPELLDELGIFVKVDDATSKYALSVGKTTSSLSDFEKRQAFANAVLEQGKQKFAAIEAAPNPYDKLLASITNLATTGLELVNKVLSPILKILAESPTALAAVFGLIGVTLLKQALPALTAWREELTKSATIAAASAQKSYEAFRDYSISKNLAKEAEAIAPIQKKINSDMANAQTALAKTLSSKSKILAQAMSGTADPAAMEKAINTEITRRQTIMDKLEETRRADTAADAAKQAAYDKMLSKQKEDIANLQVSKTLYSDIGKNIKQVSAIQVQTENAGSIEEWMRAKIAQYKKTQAISKGILAQTGVDTETKGVKDAFKGLFDNIKNGVPILDEAGNTIGRSTEGLKGMKAATTAVKGGFLILGSAIGTALQALGPYMQMFALAVAAYEMFDSVASNAAKQQESFNTKITEGQDAVKTVADTFKLYTEKKKDAFSIDGVVAFTNSLSQVSKSFDTQVDALKDFEKAANVWDRLKDSIAGVFGKSNTDKLKKNAVDSVQAILKALEFSSSKDTASKDLADTIGIKPEQLKDVKALKQAVNSLGETKLEELAKQFKLIEEREQFATNAAKAFIESLSSIDKLVDQMIQANAFTDLQGKIGVELVVASERLAQALQDPLKALGDIAAISKDPKIFAIIGDNDIEKLVEAQNLVRAISDAELDLAKRTKESEKATATLMATQTSMLLEGSAIGDDVAQVAADAAQASMDQAEIALESLKRKAVEFAQAQADLVAKLSDEGFRRVELGLKRAQEQAQIAVSRAQLAVASSAGLDTSSAEFKLKMQDLSIQRELVQASYDAQIATNNNTDTLKRLTATQEVLAAEALRAKSGSAEERAANAKLADSMEESANKTLASVKAKAALKNNVSESAVEAEFGKTATSLAKSSIKTDSIAEKQKAAALAKISGEEQIAAIDEITKRNEYLLKTKLAQLGVDKERTGISLEEINQAIQAGSYATDALLDTKQSLQLKTLESDIDTKRTNLLDVQTKLERGKNSVYKDTYTTQKAINDAQLANLNAEQASKKLAIEIAIIKEKGAALGTKISLEAGIESEKLRISSSVQDAKLASLQKELDLKQQLGYIDDQTANAAKGSLELQSQAIRYKQEELRLNADVLAKQQALDTAKKVTTAYGVAAEANPTEANMSAMYQAVEAQKTAQQQLDNAKQAVTAGKEVNDITVASIKNNTELNGKLLEQKDHLASIANLTENLSAIFGNLGKSLGGVVSAFDSLATNQEKRLEKEKNIAKELKAGTITQTKAGELRQRNAIDEINDQARIAGSVKSMFKEKTLAYKAFHTVETGLRMASLAMELKASFAKISAWWTEVSTKAVTETALTGATAAGAAARAPLTFAEIVGNFTKTIPAPFGMVAGLAAGAYFLSLLGLGGGNKGGAPGGFTAAEQQKVQGTGQMYDSSGNLVQRAGGVTGDVTAVANSVKTSIEGLSKDFFNLFGSNNSSNIVKALVKIEDNTGDMVKAFLGKLVGFGAGSQFGTVESSSKVLGGLWGKSSTTIADVGVQVNGFLQNLGKGIGAFQQYENVVQKSSSWFGLSKSTSYFTNLGDIPKAAKQALQDIFGNVGTVLTESAVALEGNASRVNNMLNQIPIDFKVSLKGLTGEEAAKAIMSEVSVQLNAAAEKVFPYLEKYNRIGEEMYQTVARIVKEGEVLNQGLIMIGKTMSGISAEVTVAFQQDLIAKAGGIDKFATSIQYYFDNFISAQKRYEVSFSALNQRFKDAGMTLPKSKQAYMDLVEQADTTTETGRQQLATLLTLAEQYNTLLDSQAEAYKDQITSLTDTISKFRDFAKTLNDFKSSLLLSASSTATPLEKYAEAKTQFESTYALALSGDKDAMGKLTGISQTFLDMSKQLFASSDAYTKDFNTVLDKINTASISASASADVAQLQLDAINTQIGLLSSINDNIATIAGVPAKAGGGRVSGLTLVGERGPELVDFSTPGRVYTADQTAGMFTSGGGMGPAIGAMVAEIQQLREEVCALRKDQQKQTGDLIISNYDANQKAAEEVATAVVTASADNTWTERSKSEIK